jgi:hypothetical protein
MWFCVPLSFKRWSCRKRRREVGGKAPIQVSHMDPPNNSEVQDPAVTGLTFQFPRSGRQTQCPLGFALVWNHFWKHGLESSKNSVFSNILCLIYLKLCVCVCVCIHYYFWIKDFLKHFLSLTHKLLAIIILVTCKIFVLLKYFNCKI